MPPRATPFLAHPYKCPGGMGGGPSVPKVLLELLREIIVHHLSNATFFALSFHALAHSFIFRILYALYLPARRGGPLICEFYIPEGSAGRKLPGVTQQFPFWFTQSACREGNSPRRQTTSRGTFDFPASHDSPCFTLLRERRAGWHAEGPRYHCHKFPQVL